MLTARWHTHNHAHIHTHNHKHKYTQPYLVYSLTGPSYSKVLATPALRDAFLIRNGTASWRAPAPGERCCARPALAATLDKIAEQGPGWLYSQAVAGQMAAEIQKAGGVMTQADLTGVKARIVRPLTAQVLFVCV